MPHINRIRVNNVKYNFGTQYYDDFVMRLSGKNTIYDLANGGGKSVLMLLLLQNLIPNCTLDEKQPIEKLFRSNSGSTVIHSMIEWNLSDIHIKENYKYMLTGFCARKAREAQEEEEVKDTASIEYFNYCIFYREFNDHDLKNFPLSDGKERVTYSGLKNYLKELGKKDLSLQVHVFDRKGDYQHFIAQYGLYESEWEIIRGINKTEGHVRTYFESNYRTTRKVVEDLFIEEIIQKSFQNKMRMDGQEDVMAKTLLDIKDKLVELAKKKGEIQSYDRQKEVLEEFSNRLQSIRQVYFGREKLNQELVQAYHLLKQMEQEEEKNAEQIKQEKQQLFEQKKKIYYQLDAMKVKQEVIELQEYEAQLEKREEEQKSLEQEIKDCQNLLLLLESGNDYLDYRYYKNQRDEIREAMQNSKRDSGDLIEEIYHLASEKKYRMEQEQKTLQNQYQEQQSKAEQEEKTLLQMEEQERELDRNLAVLSGQEEEIAKRLEENRQETNQKKNQTGLLLAADAQKELQENSRKLAECQEKKQEFQQSIEEVKEQQNKLQIELRESEMELALLEKEWQKQVDIRKQEEEYQKKLEMMQSVYGLTDIRELSFAIEKRQEENVLELAEQMKELLRLQERMHGFQNQQPVVASEALKKVHAYIEKYHGDIVVYGADILARMEPEGRRRWLEQLPILPYSLIAVKQYEQLISDGKLRELAGEYVIPIIHKKALEDGEALMDADQILLLLPDKELFYQKEKSDAQAKKIGQKVGKCQEKIAYLKDRQTVMKEDFRLIQQYLAFETANESSGVENILSRRKEYENRKESVHRQWQENQEGIGRLEEQLEICENALKEINEEREVYERLVNLVEEEQELTIKKRNTEMDRVQMERDHTSLAAKLQAMKTQHESRSNRIRQLKEKQKELETEWNQIYKKYYHAEYPRLSISDDELVSRFQGRVQVYEKDNSDLEDKQRLMDNYDTAMARAATAIDYKGMSMEELAARYENHEIIRTENEDLLALKQKLEHRKKQEKESLKVLKDITSRRDKLDGSIGHAILLIQEKYGSYEEVKEENLENALAENRKVLGDLEDRLVALEDKENRQAEDSKKLLVISGELERIVEEAKLDIHAKGATSSLTGQNEEELVEHLQNISKSYHAFVKDTYAKREQFEHEKQLLIDTLQKLEAVSLAETVRRNVKMPETLQETDELIQSVGETVACIDLEKNRVSTSIENMETIKKNFENQCLQSCLNIKIELDRLPQLSRISLDGETISIISLVIPYVKEELQAERMSAYIDEIVETADDMKNANERLKYIKSRLAWKRLFSVIVTDMNGIRLLLYKRERIKEQSRYLKYEEAVGSTGQSQGIYIQFLIAVINYISSIHSQNSDSSRLKKVIFIDNPFGAAKDIYIWEPIFQLLKTNNVQLVVPARGTTPAITGRFDVNYVLGQKLIDGKQQTVVVDYFSSVNQEQMEYTTLSYEQTTLF